MLTFNFFVVYLSKANQFEIYCFILFKKRFYCKIWDLLKTGFGIETIRHLIFHFPHRHDDYSDVRKIGSLIAGEKQSLLATVWDVSLVPAKGKSRGRIVVTLYDETGNIKVTLFGQKWAI